MKNKLNVMKVVGLGLLICVLLISCTTPPPSQPLALVTHEVQTNITLPARGSANNVFVTAEFDPVGIVFVNSTEVVDQLGNRTGSQITYEMFMREAARLDAHEVININVDVNIRRERQIIQNRSVVVSTYTYTGTGLAIRFRNAELEMRTNSRDDIPDTMGIPTGMADQGAIIVLESGSGTVSLNAGLTVTSVSGRVQFNAGGNTWRIIRVGNTITPDTIIRIRGSNSSLEISDGIVTQTISGENNGRLSDLIR